MRTCDGRPPPAVDGRRLLVTPYDAALWNTTRELIDCAWISRNHPLCDRSLFEWQYRLPCTGHKWQVQSEPSKSLLLVSNNRSGAHVSAVGFFGCTHLCIRLNAEVVVENCGEVSMWFIDPNLYGSGAGMLLLDRAIDDSSLLVGFNLNTTSQRLYGERGAILMPEVPRFFSVLNSNGMALMHKDGSDSENISSLASTLYGPEQNTELPIASGAESTRHLCSRLAAHWLRCAAPYCGIAIERDAPYWHWRYFSSPGNFKYLVFGDDARGYVVMRTEDCRSGHYTTASQSALRIVELLPSAPCAWNAGCDTLFASLLRGVCVWALREHNACVADFWCTSTRFERTLNEAGFCRDTESHGVPMMFSDTSMHRARLNACILLKNCEFREPFDWENTYFTKTTGDSDRPTLGSRAV